MANKTVEILLDQSGLSVLTVDLFPFGSDTRANGSGDTMSEQTNRKGCYQATVTEAITGLFTCHIYDDGTLIKTGVTRFASDAVGVYRIVPITMADMIYLYGVESSASGLTDFVSDYQESGYPATNGNGARSVTITVNDGSTAIANATVRMTQGVETYTGLTNSSGVATFNLDDGTWTVGITKAGYTYAGTTLAVDGTETATYSMTAVSITPASDPSQTTGYLTTRDGGGTVQGNVTIQFKLNKGPGDSGHSYDAAAFSATSHATTGLLQVTLLREADYVGIRGDGTEIPFTTADASTYQLPELLGFDAD